MFKHCSTTSCGYLFRCHCLLHAVEPCHAIDLDWLIVDDWFLKCRDGLKLCPGECNSWQRGICLEFWWVSVFGNPVCAIAKAEEFPEQFSALFAWWAFGGNHFKLTWPAPWCGLASLLWQQGVNRKGPKERRQTDQMVSRCYIWLYMVQECSRCKIILFTQGTFLGVSSLKVSMTSAGFLQIEQHYAAKPREKWGDEEGEHIIHLSRQPGHAYCFIFFLDLRLLVRYTGFPD